ncbi:hypothetical protein PTSG_11736 [Salpingoeca rosetta]|uniref:DUF924 domain-containing protein n=1 Tax=Salpingoeca rosetta (strain ATCC 50818 / BSB-021) TaxID=946362 RepID=F2U0E5_SALR5|nr:uncharacterized protein PTSG_11736 [Salpingoeca rosetta]EGD80873.1 hypothetical protein PTSG_11736 [Salpingoeca rosetta]|eukprot:XP_004997434.1 hypothetical protein PTSG_11736 [Salpingoeca rosetta]
MASFLARATAAGQALPARASAILTFWFGQDPHWPASPSTTEVVARTAYLASLPHQMKLWFAGGKEVDEQIRSEFAGDLAKLDDDNKAYDSWVACENPRASLALILLTDQFTRNIFRGSAKCFSYDSLALNTTLQLLDDGRMRELRPVERMFALMPLEHSEDLAHHERMAAELQQMKEEAESYGDEGQGAVKLIDAAYGYLQSHTKVLEQFGRYPHRNKALGRETTAEEAKYLETAETWGQ